MIFFQVEWLCTKRLNQENLNDVQLEAISGNPSPPLVSGCLASHLATFSLPPRMNKYISDSIFLGFSCQCQGEQMQGEIV